MRFILPLTVTLVFSSLVQAQVPKEQSGSQAAQKSNAGKMDHMAGPWKEMNAFHTLLAAAFHPVKEKKNFKPLRQNADKLAAAARTWAASTAPAACAADAIKSQIVVISVDALATANQVMASASDADLTLAIDALHEKFEAVEKACAPHDMKGMKHN